MISEFSSVIYVIHDRRKRYWKNAIKHENNISRIVCVSENVYNLVSRHIVNPNKLLTIPNALIDFPVEMPSTYNRKEKLVYVGGDDYNKGYFCLLKVAKYLSKMNYQGSLDVVGHVSTKNQNLLIQNCKSYKPCFHGKLPNTSLRVLLRSSSGLLMLSKQEAFGLIVLEAVAEGCPIVNWDISGGPKDILGEGYFLSVKKGDYKAYAQAAMKTMPLNQQALIDLFEKVGKKYSKNNLISSYQNLFRSTRRDKNFSAVDFYRRVPSFKSRAHIFDFIPLFLKQKIREFF